MTPKDLYYQRLDQGMDEKKAYRLYRMESAGKRAVQAGRRAGRKIREEYNVITGVGALTGDDEREIKKRVLRLTRDIPRQAQPAQEEEAAPAPRRKTNWLLWGGLGAMGVAGYYLWKGK